MKHTAAPWKIQKLRAPTGNMTHEVVTNEYDIAVGIRKEADAHLIAAAPELLECLQNIIYQLDPSCEGCFVLESRGNFEAWEAVGRARDTIVKAMGNQK